MKLEKQFAEISRLIQKARNNAFKAVNKELINLYWQVGEYISKKLKSTEWGDGVVDELASYLKRTQPNLKGFDRRGLYRMKQFYDTYKDFENVSPLVTQISWTNNLMILSKTKTIEEKEFYLRLSIREKYSKRELERQINSSYFERTMLSNKKVSPLLTQFNPDISKAFKDTYVFEFLNLPENHSESDLKKALIINLKKFILEIGKDFSFIGEEYRLQVGAKDFYLDLLFFHRELQCLVVFDLKIEDFSPAHLGQLNFYLEALDRDVKKKYEKPSVGVLLCKGKDAEVVEYALSRNISPAMVADYETKLIPKKLLQQKLHEFFELAQANVMLENN